MRISLTYHNGYSRLNVCYQRIGEKIAISAGKLGKNIKQMETLFLSFLVAALILFVP